MGPKAAGEHHKSDARGRNAESAAGAAGAVKAVETAEAANSVKGAGKQCGRCAWEKR